ncbi:T7SS effector LXG polymorphic toxin [Enterococcus termitis]|uniref:LXG domain-containing protein n=1 Tax=Enterococcus termitis TaxID=332950 RepID=A0A1E5GIK0_9ENTE|nr:T7SS effector LXG polymorphic toxin [Enterococcus termitis]OEG12509.1 hypothetical protein BCR25_08210 [Enterococcus termitis]
MSVDMYVSTSRSQASSVSTMCKSQVEGYHELQKAITDFVVASPFLTGKAYDSAKDYFQSVLYPLAQGGILLSEAVEKAVKKFPEEYISQVDSGDLKQSELEEKIRRADRLLNQAEDIRKDINSSKTPDITKTFQLIANSMLIGMYSASKQKLEEQLRKLLAFNASSPSIFSEISSLQSAMNTGLAQTKTAWNEATGTFSIPKDLSWKNTINERWKSYQEKNMTSEQKLLRNLETQFGFSNEESQLLMDIYQKLKNEYGADKANKLFWQLLASPVYTGNLKDWGMWSYTGGLNSDWRTSLGKLGLTKEELNALENMIWNQYNLCSGIYKNPKQYYNSFVANQNVDWNKLSVNEQQKYIDLFNQFNNKVDFSHMAAIIASYMNNAILEDSLGESIGLFNGVGGLNNNSGYIGDIAGVPGAKPSLGNDDYRADLDSVNIFNRISESTNSLEAMNQYFNQLTNGKTNRAEEFVTNIGNGSYNEGIAILQQQYNDFINGGAYKDMSVEEQKVFAEFLLNVINSNNSLK